LVFGGDNDFAKVSPMHPIVSSLRTRTRTLGATAGILLTLAPHVSTAQPVMSYALSWPGLTQDDIDRMNAAGARLYEGRSIGTVERWRSPDSKDAGEVKLIRSFNTHGMPCRTLDHTIRFETQRDSPSHYIINWCKIPDDGWKIVEVAPPR
jgi:surface antigen